MNSEAFERNFVKIIRTKNPQCDDTRCDYRDSDVRKFWCVDDSPKHKNTVGPVQASHRFCHTCWTLNRREGMDLTDWAKAELYWTPAPDTPERKFKRQY